ncbi:unnamed protein product [Spirodela intermedia]|uniref:Uncharacterized protein n=1 Tax=Spirodela intermedia TaxID=51605 RepID=A0A7I8KD66_SPIIN|nr:unnamed protein product [Spirodela intermedia]
MHLDDWILLQLLTWCDISRRNQDTTLVSPYFSIFEYEITKIKG